jgi:hypothetical protein
MTTESQRSANHRNALLSTGPRTARGRMVSSQNARKHGMRAAREEVMRAVGYSFEERKRKWVGGLDPRNDREEFIANQQFMMASEVERVQAAAFERIRSQNEDIDLREREDVYRMGKRLFFDRCGATGLYGLLPKVHSETKTSFSGEADDPDDPGLLVMRLEATATGCQFLWDEWSSLKERLEGEKFWQSIDRIKACRLLGHQPTAVAEERCIAEIFVASHGIAPGRKASDRDLDPNGKGAFEDLSSDLGMEGRARLAKNIKERWTDLVRPTEKAKCRQILVDLVEENLEYLKLLLEEHDENIRNRAEQTFARLGHESGRDAENMRQHTVRCLRAFNGMLQAYSKVRKEEGEQRTEGGGRRAEERGVRAESGGRRTEEAGFRAESGGRRTEEAGFRTEGGGRITENRDWGAPTIDASDVAACGGFVPDRCIEPGGGDQAERGESEAWPNGMDAPESGAGVADGTRAGSSADESGEALVAESVVDLTGIAPATDERVEGETIQRPDMGLGRGSGDGAPSYRSSGSRLCPAIEEGAEDENFTNEANFGETVTDSQSLTESNVKHENEVSSRLDTGENEANFGLEPEGGTRPESCELSREAECSASPPGPDIDCGTDDGSSSGLGGAPPTRRTAPASAAALPHRLGRKARREMARREEARRLRALIETFPERAVKKAMMRLLPGSAESACESQPQSPRAP